MKNPNDEEEYDDERNDPVDDREDDFPEYEPPVGELNRDDALQF